MSDSWSGKFNDIKSRIQDAVGNSEGEIDVDSVVGRVRETVGKAGSDLDADALVARFKETVSKTEGTVPAEKIRQWIDDVDQEKLKGWLDEAKGTAATAASFVEAQGELVAERAPGVVDKLIGAAKETLGDFAGYETLAREGELQHLKGDIEERLTGAADTVEDEVKSASDVVNANRDPQAG